jgi:hypothetical protein
MSITNEYELFQLFQAKTEAGACKAAYKQFGKGLKVNGNQVTFVTANNRFKVFQFPFEAADVKRFLQS